MPKTTQTQSHIENSILAKQGRKPGPPPWKPRRHQVTLSQDDSGNWLTHINGSHPGLHSTDVEISLWLDLQDSTKDRE